MILIIYQGPFQTTQLLSLSGIGPSNILEKYKIPVLIDLPVGNKAIYIPFMIIIPSLKKQYSSLINPVPQLSLDQLLQLYFNKSGPLSQFAQMGLYFSTKTNTNKEWPNIHFSIHVTEGQVQHVARLYKLKGRGSVSIQSNDPYVAPKYNSNLLNNDRDMEDMVSALKFIFYLLESTEYGKYYEKFGLESYGCSSCPGKFIYQCDDGLRCLIRKTDNFLMNGGTSRMGAIERNDVVVGPDLKVKHAQNLRICDSSINPESPNGFLSGITMMIGEKCSDLIKQGH